MRPAKLQETGYESKLCLPSELRDHAARLPRPLVLTNGVFDLLHRGHVDYLQRAKAMGSSLLVAVNDDASARRLGKGEGRPFNGCEDRMALLAALASTDLVTCFSDDHAQAIVELVRPDLYVKGGDYQVEQTPEGRTAISLGARVAALPFQYDRSTTALVERVRDAGAKGAS